ncbi:MAG: DUF4974 domain-containing protein [Cytophagales bacterium]|nr:DUF4974 domain-containing protein [Cytophagales bacterium]
MTKELLIRFSKGLCSEDEAYEVITWLKGRQSDRFLNDVIDEDIKISLEHPNVDKHKEHKALLERIIKMISAEKSLTDSKLSHKSAYSNLGKTESRTRSAVLINIFKIAASLLLVGIIGYAITWVLNNPGSSILATEISMVTKENSVGRKSVIYLPDGSKVHLNSESKITYPDVFSDTCRLIYLQGEAHFEVRKDPSRPFTVRTGDIAVTALGTEFNVMNFVDEPHICVALESGRVVVNEIADKQKGDKIYLDPGNGVSYLKGENTFFPVRAIDLQYVLAWKDGNIIYKKADLKTVLKSLQRWYGVTIHVGNMPDYKWSYSAEFRDQSLQNVLESMSFSQNFNYSIEGKKVVIEFKK